VNVPLDKAGEYKLSAKIDDPSSRRQRLGRMQSRNPARGHGDGRTRSTSKPGIDEQALY